MSWDVHLFGVPDGVTSIGELPRDYNPPSFERATAIERIMALFPGDVDFSDPTWGRIGGDGWSIEVNLGKEPTIQGFMLHVRGRANPLPAIFRIAGALHLRALDCSNGDLLDPENSNTSAFDEWLAFRNRAIED